MLILHDIQSNVVTDDTNLLQVSHQVSHSQVSTQIGMEFNEYIRFKQVELDIQQNSILPRRKS